MSLPHNLWIRKRRVRGEIHTCPPATHTQSCSRKAGGRLVELSLPGPAMLLGMDASPRGRGCPQPWTRAPGMRAASRPFPFPPPTTSILLKGCSCQGHAFNDKSTHGPEAGAPGSATPHTGVLKSCWVAETMPRLFCLGLWLQRSCHGGACVTSTPLSDQCAN